VYKVHLFEVLVRSLQQTYLLIVVLRACSVSCGGLFLFSLGVAQILNSNGLNGKNLTFSFILDVTT